MYFQLPLAVTGRDLARIAGKCNGRNFGRMLAVGSPVLERARVACKDLASAASDTENVPVAADRDGTDCNVKVESTGRGARQVGELLRGFEAPERHEAD